MTDTERALGRRWFEEVWNKARREAIVEMITANSVIHDGDTETVGPAGFYGFYDRIRSAFPEIHITVDDTFSEADKICVRWTCTAAHTGVGLGFPATNRIASFTGMCILRVSDGKIAEAWQNWDMLGMIEQLKGTRTTTTYIGAR